MDVLWIASEMKGCEIIKLEQEANGITNGFAE